MSTYQELQQQIAELRAQAEAIRQQEQAQVIAHIKQQIQEYGITAAQLGFRGESVKASGRKSTVEPKYRDNQTGETWGGVGAKPKWLRNHEAAGRNKDEFRI